MVGTTRQGQCKSKYIQILPSKNGMDIDMLSSRRPGAAGLLGCLLMSHDDSKRSLKTY